MHKHQDVSFDNKAKLLEMSYPYVISRAIHVAAILGVADHLINDPKSVNELATLVGAEPQIIMSV